MVDSRSNQLIAAASEGYKRRIDCVRNLERVATVGRPGVRFQRGRRGERVSMEIET